MAKDRDPKPLTDEEFEEALRGSSIGGPYDPDKVDELIEKHEKE